MKTTYRQRRAIAAKVRPRLVQMFPACFAGKGEEKHPLKVKIKEDILAITGEFTSLDLYCAIGDYTDGPTYLRNMVEGAVRIDLDGNPAGAVSAADEGHAKAKLRRFDRWAAKDRKKQAEAAE